MNISARKSRNSVNIAKFGRLLLGFNRLIDFRLLNIFSILLNNGCATMPEVVNDLAFLPAVKQSV